MVLACWGGCSVAEHPEVTIEILFVLEGPEQLVVVHFGFQLDEVTLLRWVGKSAHEASLQALPLTLSKALLSSVH